MEKSKKPAGNSLNRQAKVRVYTVEPDPECYPEGLANSIHIACETADSVLLPLNRNYGILFAEGRISAQNTIIPLGVRHPVIFCREDGMIAIAAERVHEDGSPDELARDKMLLWITDDLIHFKAAGLVSRDSVFAGAPTDTLSVDWNLVQNAVCYWSPVVCTGVSVPDYIRADSEEELEGVRAQILYSDGSDRQKRIVWDKNSVHFNRPGTYQVTGRLCQQSFRFPLAEGYGDPVVFPWEGKWYYISTNDNLNDIGLYVREAENVQDLFSEGVQEHLILPFDPDRGFEQTFWAPEFHVIGGELYILFAVSGHVWGPQCHMMKKKKGGSIILAGSWENPVRVVRKDGKPLAEEAITLDMTYIKAQSGSYVIWSYREHIGTPLDSGSMLYIASVRDNEPWKLTSEPVLLTRPLYGWENVAGTINNEGPNAFERNGRIYVTYSGGSANRYTYALGLLTAETGSDLLNLSSWNKSATPVLTFRSVEGEFGPGHNSFFVNDEGELMIAYHAETGFQEMLRCDGIRRVHFRANGEPYFQMSAGEDLRETEIRATVVVMAGSDS